MEIIDISRDLMKTPVYPGDPEGYVDPIKNIRAGDSCNLNSIYTCLHTATHIDAPLHFIEGGNTIDKFPLDLFVGECLVVEAPPGPITGAFAEEAFPWEGCERVLIKGNGLSYLMESSAYYVADSGIKLIGTDSQTIGNHSSNQVIHRALLGADIPIVEGLDLSGVEPGRYFLMAQPLKVSGVEAAPCRAILIKEHLFWTGSRG
ncbi:MAG: cyclase family protein [Clostridia bacterium]|jgi:arylformamidase|nr:cyclase family protein [Clostridia bacterium]